MFVIPSAGEESLIFLQKIQSRDVSTSLDMTENRDVRACRLASHHCRGFALNAKFSWAVGNQGELLSSGPS